MLLHCNYEGASKEKSQKRLNSDLGEYFCYVRRLSRYGDRPRFKILANIGFEPHINQFRHCEGTRLPTLFCGALDRLTTAYWEYSKIVLSHF